MAEENMRMEHAHIEACRAVSKELNQHIEDRNTRLAGLGATCSWRSAVGEPRDDLRAWLHRATLAPHAHREHRQIVLLEIYGRFSAAAVPSDPSENRRGN